MSLSWPRYEDPETPYISLYRPVGLFEMELIANVHHFYSYPPRLPGQPIFYPVLNIEYATKIARDWNTKDGASGYAGFVTGFRVPEAALSIWPPKCVGGKEHMELWVPADQLPAFNALIAPPIQIYEGYRGPNCDDADMDLLKDDRGEIYSFARRAQKVA